MKRNIYFKWDGSLEEMKDRVRVAQRVPGKFTRTILNSHRVIGIATNTSMMLNYALVTYIMMTADAGLPNAV